MKILPKASNRRETQVTSLVPINRVPIDATEGEPDALPKIGQWYWVAGDKERWFGCVTHVGTNFAKVETPEHSYREIHFDNFDKVCTIEPDADAIIDREVGARRRQIASLMSEVRELSAHLCVSPDRALTVEASTQALALRGDGQAPAEYKAALIKAEKETLPALFKKIKESSEKLGEWLSASTLPMQAEVKKMETSLKSIKDRIFHVELYAGVIETVEQVAEGMPAHASEKVRLMQRRHYMDEECLVAYEAGGMEFRNIGQFDEWMAAPRNRDRILPHPRCVVAFQVRRRSKERDVESISNFVNISFERDADESTFLYIRNGEQIFRLSTKIDFGAQLFPDVEHQVLDRGKIWAKMFCDRVEKIVSDNTYQGMREDALRKRHETHARAKAAPEKDSWWILGHSDSLERTDEEYLSHDFRDWKPFHPDRVEYDKIAAYVTEQIAAHNRLMLVLQGLFDRSPVFQPHAPVALWTPEGFASAVELVYDNSRALAAGDAPDFEAYRAKCNASLVTGSVTVGQEEAWERAEAEKENERRGVSSRWRDVSHLVRFCPEGNPGPGTLARITRLSRDGKKCSYSWMRDRLRETWRTVDNKLPAHFSTATSNLLNVEAYKPGDFHQFFDDPRTRADYLKWAPLLLAAEDYHAGKKVLRGEAASDIPEDED